MITINCIITSHRGKHETLGYEDILLFRWFSLGPVLLTQWFRGNPGLLKERSIDKEACQEWKYIIDEPIEDYGNNGLLKGDREAVIDGRHGSLHDSKPTGDQRENRGE